MTGRPPALVVMTGLKMVIRHLRLVEYARELGVVPVLVFGAGGDSDRLRALTARPDHPLSAVGALWPVPDATVAGVLGSVQGLVERYDVRGVLSCGEYFVEPAAALAEVLGLPGPGWSAAAASRNKLLQRYSLADHSPRWRVVHPRARDAVAGLDRDWDGPLVVKPTGRMSSSGVRQLASPADLASAVGDYPAGETLLVEQRVTGPEFSVESLVQGGEPRWTGITGKRTNEDGGGTFVEMAHTVPATGLDAADAADLTEVNARVLRRLAVRDAIAHAEYRVSGQGVRLMEIALRVPGDGLSVLWHLATGASMEERIVDLALGREVSYPAPVRRSRHVYLDHPVGTLVDVRADGIPVSWTTRDERWPHLPPASRDAPPRACAVLVSKLAGSVLGDIVDSDARSASVLVDAPLDADIEAAAAAARARVEVVVA